MQNWKKIIKRYRFFGVFLVINLIVLFIYPELGKESFIITAKNLKEMLMVIPPIFVLLGLLDVWVEKETMMKFMGADSGIKGALLAFLLGSAAAGPLYAAFPVAGILLKKGVRLFNVFLFIGAWATTKLPLILFEVSSLGFSYMFLRFICNLIGIVLIAFLLEKATRQEEREKIYEMSQQL
ncbi:permease [Anaeromicropila populeti]|uniref:Predicted permease n=1 Tax=Anaeromicropila populeti TaxID=37658 RepID=A0A1I6HIG8_9FIRM|nr:permease [Anaeromicropila populeti]SFR54154.1 Predicted permease [Anaeromicropila populeti]